MEAGVVWLVDCNECSCDSNGGYTCTNLWCGWDQCASDTKTTASGLCQVLLLTIFMEVFSLVARFIVIWFRFKLFMIGLFRWYLSQIFAHWVCFWYWVNLLCYPTLICKFTLWYRFWRLYAIATILSRVKLLKITKQHQYKISCPANGKQLVIFCLLACTIMCKRSEMFIWILKRCCSSNLQCLLVTYYSSLLAGL